MSRINIIGCPVDSLDMKETIERIDGHIKRNELCQHVVVNVSKYVEMQTDPKLKDIITSCDIINADGMPIVWASWLLGQPLPERVAGVDLFQELVRVGSEKGYRPFSLELRSWLLTRLLKHLNQNILALMLPDIVTVIIRMMRKSKLPI